MSLQDAIYQAAVKQLKNDYLRSFLDRTDVPVPLANMLGVDFNWTSSPFAYRVGSQVKVSSADGR